MKIAKTEYICCLLDDHTIRFKHCHGLNKLDISFKRTVRVADHGKVSKLPPSLGNFPLHRIADFADTLSTEMVSKGGLFFPMHQNEAMWINFVAEEPFLIKIYAGGINVVSGEHVNEDDFTNHRRKTLRKQKKSLQDYVVVPNQKWIDGVATSPGVVRQFVAMPLGKGYSVEAQLTGKETVGGLQFEITPAHNVKPRPQVAVPNGDVQIFVKTIVGETVPLYVRLSDTVAVLKDRIYQAEGVPQGYQRLIYYGKQLNDLDTLSDISIEKESTVHLVLQLRGGGPGDEMAVAAGGLIKQTIVQDKLPTNTWNESLTTTFNVQILNSATYKKVTGQKPPNSPISQSVCAKYGIPFFDMWEHPSTISGSFNKVKSVSTTDKKVEKGDDITSVIHLAGDGSRIDKDVHHRIMDLVANPDHILNEAGALRTFRTLHDLEKEVDEITLNSNDSDSTAVGSNSEEGASKKGLENSGITGKSDNMHAYKKKPGFRQSLLCGMFGAKNKKAKVEQEKKPRMVQIGKY